MKLALRWTKLACASLVIFLASAAFAGFQPTAVRASPPPAGQLTPVGSAPNYFYTDVPAGDTNPGDIAASANVATFSDPTNHLLFEYEANPPLGKCVNLVSFDIDSYALKATDAVACASADPSKQIAPANPGHSKAPSVAIDSADRLLFMVNTSGAVIAVSEDSLQVVFSFVPPVSASLALNLLGVSWYQPTDQLLVLYTDPTLGIAEYDVAALVRSAGSTSPSWTSSVPGCVEGLTPTFSTYAAYFTNDGSAVLVPCILVPPAAVINRAGERDGVVRIAIGLSGPANPPIAAISESPGLLSDVYFDPGSSRMFLPVTGSSSVDLLVYDGVAGDFIGKATVGGAADAGSVAVGLEPQIGRLYAIAPSTGITILDGRDTPVSPGGLFAGDKVRVGNTLIAPLPPDANVGYERLLVPVEIPYGGGYVTPQLTVYADTLAVSQPSSAGSVDTNTINGPVPPGAILSEAHSGSAAGYGFHDDYVGGANAVVSDASAGGGSAAGPFTGSSDLLGADVSKLLVDSTSGNNAGASAFGDGSGSTSGSYQQCSGASAVGCLPPAPCPASGVPCTPPPPPPGVGGSQPWPYPVATCFAPGPAQSESAESNGVYGSGGPAPGSDSNNSAVASVNCAASNAGATAAAQFGHAQTGAAGLPGVTMGYSSVSATITPGSSGAGLVNKISAESNGTSIDLGNGVNITFGRVSHNATATAAGTAGSATNTDAVTISNIVVNGTDLCAAAGCDSAIAQINAEFPTLIKIIPRPAADGRYATTCTHPLANPNENDCKGSPGGYLSCVQASLDEQYGDQQFNGMSEQESTILPAMRIILYGYADGVPSLSRQVIDLAGVQGCASQGLQVNLAGTSSVLGTSTSIYTQTGCASCAGVPATSATTGAGVAAAATTYPGGVAGVVERVLAGLDWLVRNPGEVLQMVAFLTMLCLPIMLMRRRWRLGTGMTRAHS